MTPRNVLLAASFAVLGACGPAEPKPPAEVELTEANAASLASQAWLDNVALDASEVLREAWPLLREYLPLIALQPNGATTDVPCHASGRISLTGQVADAQQPGQAVGDRVTAHFLACREASDAYADTTDGTITLELTAVAPGSRTFTVRYDAFATSMTAFGTFTLDGTLTITLATQGDVTTVTVDAERLDGSGGGMDETVEHKHLKLVTHGNTLAAAFSLEFSATATSSRWGGRVLAYETPVAFSGTRDGFPSQGQLLLHGANAATVRMTALDATQVRLELDLDGDGVVEPARTRTLTWVQVDDADFGDSP